MARLLAEFLGMPLVSARDLPEIASAGRPAAAAVSARATASFPSPSAAIPLRSWRLPTLSIRIRLLPSATCWGARRAPHHGAPARSSAPSNDCTAAAQASPRKPGRPLPSQASEDDVRRLEDLASEAPVIRLVHELITRAVEAQASDIHVEPREDSLRVRYRLDGVLHTVETLPLSLRAAVTSRIKIMAQLNIAERRLPQDGRIKSTVRGKEIDLRVSTMPTMLGESVVLRILDRSSVQLDFAALGFAGPAHEAFAEPACPAQRHHPGHRPDGQRQDDHALHRAQHSQQARRASCSPSKTRSSISWPASTRSRCSPRSG